MITPETDEDHRQLAFLTAPQGEAGSGALRYAAAMHFFMRGMIGEAELEAYRAASKIDGSAPLSHLAAEIERYATGLDFAGKADVMAGLQRWMRGAPRAATPAQAPACAHLPAALAAMADRRLAAAIAAAAPLLNWAAYSSYPVAEIGEAFLRGNAFCSLVGRGAPFEAEDFDLGLFVIAPRTLYRDHHHPAPELYAPLTGPHGWRFKPGAAFEWRAAGLPVWNTPNAPHATLVGDVPFLAFFCWTRDVSFPAHVIPADDWAVIETRASQGAHMPAGVAFKTEG